MALIPDEAVLDASILVQTAITETYSKICWQVVDKLRAIYVPPLLFYELGNALLVSYWEGSLTKEDVVRKFKIVCEIPELEAKAPSLSRALELALELRLTVYDASYLALSLELGKPLITADWELYEKGRGVAEVLHISKLGSNSVKGLGEARG